MFNTRYSWPLAGVCFAAFWASASTATKIGLTVAQPLVIAGTRFALAAAIMLFIAHVIQRSRLPRGKEWVYIGVYGALNISIYLGLYIVAMQEVTAGIGALAVAINPVLISFFSVILLNKKLTSNLLAALFLGTAGVACAAWPLFGDAQVTLWGLSILFISMLSYALAAIYFSTRRWEGISLLTINGWQTALGGLFIAPVVWWFYADSANNFNLVFWFSVSWLAIPVSIGAVQLWLWLLRRDTVRAGLWLFLCPVFGYIIAAVYANEVISVYTLGGVALVLLGLFFAKRSSNA